MKLEMLVRSRWIWVLLILCLLVSGIVAVTPRLIDNAIDEFYSPTYTSKSIADARRRGVFVSQPILKNKMLQWAGSKYVIQEVWIEHIIRLDYQWVFFPRDIPIGYRLMLRVDEPPRFLEQIVICNNSIELNGWGG